MKHSTFVICLLMPALWMAGDIARAQTERAPAARTPAAIREPLDFSSPDGRTKVVMLGSGSPVPLIQRFGPGIAVIVDDRPYLVDAGEGIWRATQAATPAYGGRIAGLDAKNLDRLFLTHHHADHTSGLPSIIFLPWYLGADRQLERLRPPEHGEARPQGDQRLSVRAGRR